MREQRLSNKEGSNSAFGNRMGTPLALTPSGSFMGNSGSQQADDGRGSNHGAGQAASRNLFQNVDPDSTDLKSVSSPDIGTEDQYFDDDIVIEPLTKVSAVSTSSLSVWVFLIWIFSQITHQKSLTNIFSVMYGF